MAKLDYKRPKKFAACDVIINMLRCILWKWDVFQKQASMFSHHFRFSITHQTNTVSLFQPNIFKTWFQGIEYNFSTYNGYLIQNAVRVFSCFSLKYRASTRKCFMHKHLLIHLWEQKTFCQKDPCIIHCTGQWNSSFNQLAAFYPMMFYFFQFAFISMFHYYFAKVANSTSRTMARNGNCKCRLILHEYVDVFP